MSVTIHQSKQELANFNNEQINLIKNYLCKGITDDELKLFSAVCKKTGLDPFMKQIYAVKRKTKEGESMTIQTSIDGYRLIAERTGKYAPGRESSYQYDKNGMLISATSYVKKQTADGTWHEVAATAFYEEYKPAYSNQFWNSKQHIMLAKCAEALALRKAFPNELSGLYSDDEMAQADNKPLSGLVSPDEAKEILELLLSCTEEDRDRVWSFIKNDCKAETVYELKADLARKIKQRLAKLIKSDDMEVTNEEASA